MRQRNERHQMVAPEQNEPKFFSDSFSDLNLVCSDRFGPIFFSSVLPTSTSVITNELEATQVASDHESVID